MSRQSTALSSTGRLALATLAFIYGGCGLVLEPVSYTAKPGAHAATTKEGANEILGGIKANATAITEDWTDTIFANGPATLSLENSAIRVHFPFDGNSYVQTPCYFLFEVPLKTDGWEPRANADRTAFAVSFARGYRVLQNCESPFRPELGSLALSFGSEADMHNFLDLMAALAGE